MLTLNLVGFYAGLNAIAWVMIFCFVRETKQLTLEEIDRKSYCLLFTKPTTNAKYRGLPSPNQNLHQLRTKSVASLLHQAPHLQEEHHEATANYCEGRDCRGGNLDSKFFGWIRTWRLVELIAGPDDGVAHLYPWMCALFSENSRDRTVESIVNLHLS